MPNEPDYPISIEDNQSTEIDPYIKVTTGTDLIYYGGDQLTGNYSPGVYIVEVRVWADDNQDTGVFEQLEITIIDPCLSAVLTIDESDSVF